MSTEDFISIKPKLIQIVRDTELLKLEKSDKSDGFKKIRTKSKRIYDYLFDEKYYSVLVALRNGPFTLDEIVAKYNEVSKLNRKRITIYTYIQELIKASLVIQVGKRLTQQNNAKITTETLYNRSAKIFYPTSSSGDFWTKSKKGEEHLGKLMKLLRLYTNNDDLDSTHLKELVKQINIVSDEKMAKFFEEYPDEIEELLGDGSFEDLKSILRPLDLLNILLNYESYKSALLKFHPE